MYYNDENEEGSKNNMSICCTFCSLIHVFDYRSRKYLFAHMYSYLNGSSVCEMIHFTVQCRAVGSEPIYIYNKL